MPIMTLWRRKASRSGSTDLADAIAKLGNRLGNIEKMLVAEHLKLRAECARLSELLQRLSSDRAVHQDQLALIRDCVNRLTELKLASAGYEDAALRFRAVSRVENDAPEPTADEDFDWPPKDSAVIDLKRNW